MIFHSRFNKPPVSFSIFLNGVELERVDSSKFLGVIIQENLMWDKHIHYIGNKISKSTALLARLKHYLPKYILKMIYSSLCLSHISYAITVWGASPKSVIDRLHKLHKKGIRHICNAKYNSHTDPLFKKEKILKLEDLFKLQCAKIMYRKFHGNLHEYHSSKLLTNFDITQTTTRKKDDIYIDSHSNNVSRINSINYKIGTSWNELSLEVRNYASKSIQTFTQQLKKSYLSKYAYTCDIQCCNICNR